MTEIDEEMLEKTLIEMLKITVPLQNYLEGSIKYFFKKSKLEDRRAQLMLVQPVLSTMLINGVIEKKKCTNAAAAEQLMTFFYKMSKLPEEQK